MRRTDVMDVILDGPRVQVPVECLAREIGYTRPFPPPCLEPLQAPLELEDGSEISLEDDLPAGARFGKSASLPLAAPDEPRWVCPAHWLVPAMRAEGPTIWLDPEPVRVFAPWTIWLSARTEGGGLPGY